MRNTFKKNPNASIAHAFRKGYEVVYDLHNTIEIFHWNRFSNQTITIDSHNVIVPDDTRDLYGFEIEMYVLEHMSQVMTFDRYFLEQIALKRNTTAILTDKLSSRTSIMPLIGMNDVNMRGLLPAAGTIFMAVIVPRAKPKSIVSVLIDPFDTYVWITFFFLVLTMAITLSLFGKILGKRHFVEIVLELIMISLAGPSRAYGGSFENRIITIFCVMGIVLISSYQSLIISFMSYVRYHPEINTMAEIEEQCLFKDDKYPKYFNFKTYPNGSYPDDAQDCKLLMGRDNAQRTFMMTSLTLDDRHAFSKEDLMTFAVENFRFAKTKFFEYQLCYIVSSPLRELFVFYLQAIIESGIYEYYYNNQSQPNWEYDQDTFVDRVVKISDLLLLWYAYLCGALLSVICFVMETVIYNEIEGLAVLY
ncbi:uncharacterized protein LOC126565973 [Anopheles maculipalpis]|uniref:uncharacterized protein LOC126565973 n=1 Tax=Anopheles maculipalpis TaxID=1496333 RepID=UPI002158B0C2|nr:uncharacterized protein LOC126565973 [Anopheles maculipalpis]